MSIQDTLIVETPTKTQTTQTQTPTLRECVERAVNNYLTHLGGQAVTDVYQVVLEEVEIPLLQAIMKHTRGNQSRAAVMLGLNRGTLRKKLKMYGID